MLFFYNSQLVSTFDEITWYSLKLHTIKNTQYTQKYGVVKINHLQHSKDLDGNSVFRHVSARIWVFRVYGWPKDKRIMLITMVI